MKKSILSIVLFISTFCMGSVAIAGSSAGCIAPPTLIAEFFQDEFPSATDPADCPTLCSAWESSCKALANAAGDCLKKSVETLIALEVAKCKAEFSGADKTACISEATDAKNDARGYIADDRGEAKSDCSEAVPYCVMACGV